MIKLFVSDIDGCIGQPYRPFDLLNVARLAELIARGEQGLDHLPRFSLCSGRAYAYVEAVTQMLNVRTPVFFESGAGRFDLNTARITWSPLFTEDVKEQLTDIRYWLETDVAPGTDLMLDFGKVTQAGVITNNTSELQHWLERILEKVAAEFDNLKVYHTHVSVDVLPRVMDKARSMEWAADLLGITLGEIGFMGDTNGDINGLNIVGHSYSPSNGTPDVKAAANNVTRAPEVEGVIEAYLDCAKRNEQGALS